ncbi:MAG: divergent PAP2 family protein [Erysipelotrichaceae bacterium]
MLGFLTTQHMLLDYFPLICALSANILAQILKPVFLYFRTRKFDIRQTIASGGFPSSHTSTVVALSIAIGLLDGFDSHLFMVTLIFSGIIIYDAINVRYYAGKNIELTQQLISDLQEMTTLEFLSPIYQEKLKQVLGHKTIEAIGGILLGVITTFVLYLFI